MSFLDNIRAFIRRHELLADGDSVLVAVSGGADSVALLLALQQLGYRVHACHCNFHLRGAAADADEDFVRDLCRRRNIPLEVTDFQTADEAARTGESIEMAARRLRYEWFAALLAKHALPYVAVAHHREDNSETFFLNLVRGAGVRGLTGMRPKNGNVIRPLLGTTRAEIEQFLDETGEKYVTDQSNYDTAYRRNKLRQEVLPLLRGMNPSFDETLSRTMAILAETDALVSGLCRTKLETSRRFSRACQVWSLECFLHDPAPRLLLHTLAASHGFTSAQEDDIFEAMQHPDGQLFYSSTFAICIYRDQLQLAAMPERIIRLPLSAGATRLSAGRTINTEISDETAIFRAKESATLDMDKVRGGLYVRSVETGDRFAPFGMKGTKLVSDYLTNCHYSRLERMLALVVCDDAGPLWLVGERPDRRAAVTEGTTRTLRLTLREDHDLLNTL